MDMLQALNIDNTFNPYADTCPFNDKINAPIIRSDNLRKYIQVINQCNSILVGEAPGYLGCRRTGLPFTDNRHLETVSQIYGLPDFQIATKSGKDKENSALFMWRTVKQLKNPPFIWNIIPVHPHKRGNPLSNRTPRKRDYVASKTIIEFILSSGSFEQILAIGRVAEKYLCSMGFDPIYIRHPSQGGATKFSQQLMNILGA